MIRAVPQSSRKVLLATSIASGASIDGVARFAREAGWHLSTEMMHLGQPPRGWSGDGVLTLSPCETTRMAPFVAGHIPCVACGGSEVIPTVARVEQDYREIGRMAADHLLSRSYRNFAWAPFGPDAASLECLAGFESQLAEHGCSCRTLPDAYVRQGSRWQKNWVRYRRTVLAELRRLPLPTAVFAFNDCVAAEIVDIALDAGFAIPGDLAVLGVGDSLTCTLARVPLSSVDPGLAEIGYQAAATLDRMMDTLDALPPVTRVPPKGVVVRVSTDGVAVQDERVSRALSYISEHYPNPDLSVSAVASAIGMSRRNLERSFRDVTGGTIHDHIIDVRMREASRLLKSHPQARSSEVATLVGFTGERTFFRTFRRYFGMSPGAHRDWAVEAWDARQAEANRPPPLVVGPTPGGSPNAA